MRLKSVLMPTLIRLLLSMLLLTVMAGCGPKVPKPPPSPLAGHSGNFDTTAKVSYKELSASARVTRETPQSCSVVFTSPDSLKDLAFVFWGDHVDLSYKALSFTFDPNSVPGGAVAGIAVDAINAAMSDRGLVVDYTDEALLLTGTLDSGDFTLRLDKSEGNLLKLSVPDQDLEIEFLNFTFLD